MGDPKPLRRPCPKCGYHEGYTVMMGEHVRVLCCACHAYQYLLRKST